MTPEIQARVREIMLARRCDFGEACAFIARRGAAKRRNLRERENRQRQQAARGREIMRRMHIE